MTTQKPYQAPHCQTAGESDPEAAIAFALLSVVIVIVGLSVLVVLRLAGVQF